MIQNDLFLGHLQPGVGKNSKDLTILILEFDDVTVQTIHKRDFTVSFERRVKRTHVLCRMAFLGRLFTRDQVVTF